jgi:NADH-quinone oxidoreductase subunit L
MTNSFHLWLIPALPFVGFLLNALFGRRLPKSAVTGIALLTTAISLLLVANIELQHGSFSSPHVERVATWIAAGPLHVDFSFYLDQLTLVMLLVVTGVGFLIHIYSVGYMAHEEGYWRFFAYLNLFMFFMLVLVMAESYLLMFVGWEGVGLASYLLIGFYFERNSAANAGRKAFVVNRIGDFGFLVAMFLMLKHFGTLDIQNVMQHISAHPELQSGLLTGIALLLVLGATGKSAQIPLYVWLPDAMEGPTPVSALIHAATMVTAGVYMVARSHVLFDRSPAALTVVAIIGTATAFFAATIAMVQTDIKRALAYSTISQLGYMFMACGVAAYSAAIFHLVTHAFFKALLFLAAGSVIHALGGEQDMRAMGGLRRKVPVTFWTMSAGVFAISGIFPFAGFFSKDSILHSAFISPNGGKLFWAVGLITALLTSFYMFRVWYLTFFGERREIHIETASQHDAHESPWSMLAPLVLLAVLSLTGGWIGWPQALGGSDHFAHYLDPVFRAEAPNYEEVSLAMAKGGPAPEATPQPAASPGDVQTERLLSGVALLVALAGWFLADLVYRRRRDAVAKEDARTGGVYGLLKRKYSIDELYSAIIVQPLTAFARIVLWHGVEEHFVDGAGDVAAESAQGAGQLVRRIQSGNIRSYAGWLALGAAALLIVVIYLERF